MEDRYCNECKYLLKLVITDEKVCHGEGPYECLAPRNQFYDNNWLERRGPYRLHPSKLNKNNHCTMFEIKENLS